MVVRPSPSVSDARAAALRRDLLCARTRDKAISVAATYIRGLLGLAAADVRVVDRADVDATCAIELRSETGTVHGHLLVGAESARLGAAHDELRSIAADLAEALEIVEIARAAAEAARLREELRTRDALVRQAGDALIRDGAEVVRVVAELERRDEKINDALQAALRFQKAMLAPVPKLPGVAISTAYFPAEMISGDFYDVAVIAPDHVRIFIADATGHGVAAGLATMFIKSEYEAQKRTSASPAALLRALNEQLSSTYQNLELQLTALCLDVHTQDAKLRYASAAHPGPVLCRGATVLRLPSGGPFVGVTTGVDFPEVERSLDPGDILIAFTDGLTDADALDGSSFGDSGIAGALAPRPADAAGACAALIRALASFVGEGRGLPDDATIVALAMADRPRERGASQRPEDSS